MMIHPGNVAGADRLRSYYLGNLIGNPLDTTIAGACLIFGGVLERHPKLNFIMSHGGGFIPYSGRPLGARLGGAARSRRCMSNIRPRRISTASSTTPLCTPRRRWNF